MNKLGPEELEKYMNDNYTKYEKDKLINHFAELGIRNYYQLLQAMYLYNETLNSKEDIVEGKIEENSEDYDAKEIKDESDIDFDVKPVSDSVRDYVFLYGNKSRRSRKTRKNKKRTKKSRKNKRSKKHF
jgi:hypothetical protein